MDVLDSATGEALLMKGESNDGSLHLRLQISMAYFSFSGVAGFWHEREREGV
jgi:hypothetical protein